MPYSDELQWVDVLDDGTPFKRNQCTIVDGTDPMDSDLTNVPYGYGCGVFDIGPQPEFIESLMGGAVEAGEVADAVADAMPANAPRTCRVQLGLANSQTLPVLQDSPSNRSVFLTVWGHDPVALDHVRKEINSDIEVSKETEVPYTVNDFISSKLSEKAAESSRSYRQAIAKNVMDTLATGFSVQVPEDTFSSDGSRVYDTHNFELVAMTPCLDNKVALAVDANVGRQASVFHSPQRGSTLYLSDSVAPTSIPSHSKLSVVPGSDGRPISFASDQADALSERIVRATKMPSLSTAERTVACKLASQANSFQGVDTLEATYDTPPPLKHVRAMVDVCDEIVHVKSLVTALPPVQHSNAKLHGVVECNSVDAVLAHTTPESTHITLPNSTEWRHILTEADADKRPFAHMNDKTQVKCKESGRTIAWRIPRGDF